MTYRIKKIPGSKNNAEPDIRWPKGMRYSQKYDKSRPPCEAAWEQEKAGRCPTQLVYANGKPYIRFCTRDSEPGLMVPISSVSAGIKKGNEICSCWKKTDDFDQCLVDAGLEDQVKLGGAPKMKQQRRMRKRIHLRGLGGLSGLGQAHRRMGRGQTRGPGPLIIKPRISAVKPRMSGIGKATDSWITCRRVGKMTATKERKLPDKAFGLPEIRKYPMPDPSHAKNAKARAKQMLSKKKLSRKDYDRIIRKADRIINKCKGR